MKQIGQIAHKASRASHYKYGRVFGQLMLHWPLIIGEQFAKDSLPEKLLFPKGENMNGTLTLAVNSYKVIYFQQIQKELIERMNTYLGYQAISKLKFLQKPIAKIQPYPEKTLILSEKDHQKLDETLRSIEDKDIREQLRSIGEHVFDQHNRKSA